MNTIKRIKIDQKNKVNNGNKTIIKSLDGEREQTRNI